MTTAMVRCLRAQFPEAQIDMVVRKDFFDLIKDNPRLNQKHVLARGEGFQGLLELRSWIQAQNYDVIYDAHRSLRTLLLMPFLSAKQKFYFKKHYFKRSLALTFKLPLLKNFGRFLERYISPLAPLGVKYDTQGPELFISDKTLRDVAVKFPITQSSQIKVGLIPSAQWPGKRWPLDYFRELIEKMITQTSHHLILFGGPSDHFCEELALNIPADRLTNLQGKSTIEESGAILKSCAFVIANDTGLMHMADALKIPSILFLGPTSREMGCLPYHPKSIVLEKDLWCRPCSKNGQAPCIRKERYCLTEITPELALDAVKKMGIALNL
jgi:heptosyltransferase II